MSPAHGGGMAVKMAPLHSVNSLKPVTRGDICRNIRIIQANLLSAFTARLIIQDPTRPESKHSLGLNYWIGTKAQDPGVREGPFSEQDKCFGLYLRYDHSTHFTLKNFRMSNAVMLAELMTSIIDVANRDAISSHDYSQHLSQKSDTGVKSEIMEISSRIKNFMEIAIQSISKTRRLQKVKQTVPRMIAARQLQSLICNTSGYLLNENDELMSKKDIATCLDRKGKDLFDHDKFLDNFPSLHFTTALANLALTLSNCECLKYSESDQDIVIEWIGRGYDADNARSSSPFTIIRNVLGYLASHNSLGEHVKASLSEKDRTTIISALSIAVNSFRACESMIHDVNSSDYEGWRYACLAGLVVLRFGITPSLDRLEESHIFNTISSDKEFLSVRAEFEFVISHLVMKSTDGYTKDNARYHMWLSDICQWADLIYIMSDKLNRAGIKNRLIREFYVRHTIQWAIHDTSSEEALERCQNLYSSSYISYDVILSIIASRIETIQPTKVNRDNFSSHWYQLCVMLGSVGFQPDDDNLCNKIRTEDTIPKVHCPTCSTSQNERTLLCPIGGNFKHGVCMQCENKFCPNNDIKYKYCGKCGGIGKVEKFDSDHMHANSFRAMPVTYDFCIRPKCVECVRVHDDKRMVHCHYSSDEYYWGGNRRAQIWEKLFFSCSMFHRMRRNIDPNCSTVNDEMLLILDEIDKAPAKFHFEALPIPCDIEEQLVVSGSKKNIRPVFLRLNIMHFSRASKQKKWWEKNVEDDDESDSDVSVPEDEAYNNMNLTNALINLSKLSGFKQKNRSDLNLKNTLSQLPEDEEIRMITMKIHVACHLFGTTHPYVGSALYYLLYKCCSNKFQSRRLSQIGEYKALCWLFHVSGLNLKKIISDEISSRKVMCKQEGKSSESTHHFQKVIYEGSFSFLPKVISQSLSYNTGAQSKMLRKRYLYKPIDHNVLNDRDYLKRQRSRAYKKLSNLKSANMIT